MAARCCAGKVGRVGVPLLGQCPVPDFTPQTILCLPIITRNSTYSCQTPINKVSPAWPCLSASPSRKASFPPLLLLLVAKPSPAPVPAPQPSTPPAPTPPRLSLSIAHLHCQSKLRLVSWLQHFNSRPPAHPPFWSSHLLRFCTVLVFGRHDCLGRLPPIYSLLFNPAPRQGLNTASIPCLCIFLILSALLSFNQ